MAIKACHKGCRYVGNIMNEIFLIICEECTCFGDSWWKLCKLKSFSEFSICASVARLKLSCHHRWFSLSWDRYPLLTKGSTTDGLISGHLTKQLSRLAVLLRLQARIHTGFHRFTEIGQNFQNKKIDMYTFLIKINCKLNLDKVPRPCQRLHQQLWRRSTIRCILTSQNASEYFQPYQSLYASVKGMCRLWGYW